MMKRTIVGSLVAAWAVAAAAQHAAHEHGVARLEVAVDGSTLLVEVHGALDSFLGFEHAPRDAAERSALAGALARLQDPEQVVALPAAADCKLEDATVNDPFAGGKAAAGEATPAPGRHHHGEHAAPAHRGAEPAALVGHADLEASYRFECAKPAALTRLEVRLFDGFPRLARLHATTVTPAGQRVSELRRGRAALPL